MKLGAVTRLTPFRVLTLGLAALHTLPLRHHFADWLSRPNLSDAWKAIGAAIAIALLAAPFKLQARMAQLAWNRKGVLVTLALVLVVAHLVPAADHVPKLIAPPNVGDAWRAIGSCAAVAWFAAPRGAQLALVRLLHRPALRLAHASVLLVVLSQCAVGIIDTPTSDDAGPNAAPTSQGCTGWADPTASASCRACSASQTCQPNGCYGGYWCDTTTTKCHASPTCP
jgi:hypothetical protein